MKYLIAVLMLLSVPAHAKDKITPQTRIAEAFKMVPYLPRLKPPLPPTPHHRRAMQMMVPDYMFDHWTAYTDGHGTAGKFWIVRECSVDIKQDPGETSCKMTWAKI